jgi:hypothetical protein
MLFFSKITGGFYSDDLHGNNLPPDAVEISHELHAELLQAQSAGLQIKSTEDGKPIALEVAPLTQLELVSKTINSVRFQRAPVFAALDIMRQDELVVIATNTDQAAIDASKANLTAIQTFIQGLRDATLIDMSAMTTEPEMLLAVTNYYKALVAAAPTALKPRFKQALASK